MESIKIVWHGHACFSLIGKKHVLIDPFLTDNPLAKVKPEDLKPDIILVTHGHSDHAEDAVKISKAAHAPVVAAFELSEILKEEGAETIDINPGGTIEYDGIRVKATMATHSSSYNGKYAGNPMGFVIDMGRKIYHAGDTGYFKDMEAIGSIDHPDIALLPIGGHYTMDVDGAFEAVKAIKPAIAMPMHYNTFDVIKADPERFKSLAGTVGTYVIIPEIEKPIEI
ncbi:metal-dependent hydrolase [Thermoplasma sp.]|uniref:metal-dependent hydrolase n=1 Tax=Thermoplasma sp. TaxID=1973142 RepID=UPI001271EDF0|nr:metal-dependent hydrolase [Thermoplasma sp.]KAA8922194.1 MAG: metal-dependent hydrolase [Thermoplasma sp.]